MLESEPLIRRTPVGTQNRLTQLADTIICVVVALPTAVLNGLAATSSSSDTLGSLNSIEELLKFLRNASDAKIAYGVIALVGSEAVLFFLNKKYLLGAAKTSLDLLRRDILKFGGKLDATEKVTISENLLFFTSIATSLSFAEIGGKTLSFLGTTGVITGFTLSLFVYFATRFATANFSFSQWFDNDYQLKQKALDKLELLSKEEQNNFFIEMVRDQAPEEPLEQFLQKLDNDWATIKKDLKRVILLKYAAPVLGYLCAMLTVIPIYSGFMPSSVQGTEMLIRYPIGENAHYQNIASFSLGAVLTALTIFFYELNIQALPKHILRTGIAIYEQLVEGNFVEASRIFGLSLLAVGSSYLASIGFGFVASSALNEGYLSYLGSFVSAWVPEMVVGGLTLMLWSHLQDLINQSTILTKPEIMPAIDNQMTVSAAKNLLSQEGTRPWTYRQNKQTLFAASALSINPSDAHVGTSMPGLALHSPQ